MLVASMLPAVLFAQEKLHFNLPLGAANVALREYARQAQRQILFPRDLLKGYRANPVSGLYDADEALSLLLADTGLEAVVDESGILVVRVVDIQTEEDLEMIKSKKGLLAAFVSLFSAVGAGQQAIAQQEAPAAGALEEVLVTATRRTESLQEVGVAITNLQAEDFLDIGLDSLLDITGYTPGINMTSGGQPGSGFINMRGVTQQAGSPIVGIYIDDIPYTNSNIGFSISNNVFEGLLSDVERVEIVKGPQGTLFGANSVGGVIRYVTRDPALEEMRGKVSVDLSDTAGAGDLNQRYQGSISIPLVENKLGVTLSAFSTETAGYIDQVDPLGNPLDSEVNDSESTGYSLAALWQITDNASLKFRGIHTETEYDHPGGVSSSGNSPTYGDFVTAQTGIPFEREYDNLSVMLEIGFDWATLNWSYGTVEFESASDIDLTANIPAFAFDLGFFGPGLVGKHPDTLDPANAPHSMANQTLAAYEKDISEVRLTSADSEKFEWILGAFWTEETSADEQNIVSMPAVPNVDYGFFGLPQTYEETSFFANATYYITPDFDVSAGLRITDTDLKAGINLSGGLIVGTVDPTFVIADTLYESEDVETFMVGARWRASDDTAFYFRAANGFRPGFINPPLLGSGLFVKSDTMMSYELGAKGTLAGGLIYDVSLWSMTWEDFQATILNGGIPTTDNANSDISGEGFEGTLSFDASDNLSVRLSLAYTKSELDDDDFMLLPGTQQNISGIGGRAGEATPFIPELTASLSANYQFTVAGLAASVGGGIRYTDESESSWGLASFSPITGSPVTITVPSSTLVDLNARIMGENYGITLYANNLFDEYDLNGANPNAFTSTINPVRPRTIGVNLSYNF